MKNNFETYFSVVNSFIISKSKFHSKRYLYKNNSYIKHTEHFVYSQLSEILVSFRETEVKKTEVSQDVEQLRLKDEELKQKDEEITQLKALLEQLRSVKQDSKQNKKSSEQPKQVVKALLFTCTKNTVDL